MKAAIFLLFALAVSASAKCGSYLPYREYVYAKGQAKVTVHSEVVVKDLRVELVSYPPNGSPRANATVLASANADDSGFYVIAGFNQASCTNRPQFGLRLYADKRARFPVVVGNGTDYETIEVPEEFVIVDNESVKLFEKNIDGVLNIVS